MDTIKTVIVLLTILTSTITHAEETKERILHKEVVVSASIEQVWHAWTTSAGMASFFAPQSKIDLKIGGKYELYMVPENQKGLRGTEGCKILSYQPYQMLSFEWNFPPTISTLRKSGALTTVVLLFEELAPNQVRISLSQFGWRDGSDWDDGYEYFNKAWPYVLSKLAQHFSADQSGGNATNKEKTFVAIYDKGPNWIEGKKPSEQPGYELHFAYIMAAIKTNSVLAAGPFGDLSGGLAIFHAANDEDAQNFVERDPFVLAGVTVAKVHLWVADLSKMNPTHPATNTKSTVHHINDFTIRESWIDRHVKVIVRNHPQKIQAFEIDLPVSVKTLWNKLTTTEGLRSLHGKQAFIDLKVGGVVSEWPGVENKILSYLPNKMLSGVGSAPPQYPEVQQGGTWWVYRFEPLDENNSRLHMSLMGFKDGEKEWDKAFDYYLKANSQYFNYLAEKIASENLKPPKDRYLKQDILVKATPQQIWHAFTTKDGIESWMVAQVQIDLRVGGKMYTHYDPKGVIGDEKTIENTILSYEPNKMLSLKATKPPAGFPCPNAIKNTWSVITMDAVEPGLTRVSCIGLGYGYDEESEKLLKFFRLGNAWTLKQLQKKFQ